MGWDVVQIELNPYDLYGIEDNGESAHVGACSVSLNGKIQSAE